MGQFEAIAVSTPRSTPGAACGSLLGALVSASMAIAALSSAGVAAATCTSVSGTGSGARCTSTQTSFAVRLDKNTSVSAQGLLNGAVASGNTSNVAAAAVPNPEPGNVDSAGAAANPIAAAESMLGTDAFGPYGCEDFVDAAYGRTTATGIGHDAGTVLLRVAGQPWAGASGNAHPAGRTGVLRGSRWRPCRHLSWRRHLRIRWRTRTFARLRGRPRRADSAHPQPWLVDVVRMDLRPLVGRAGHSTWPPTRAAGRDSWPWRGCWPNRWTWYPFREPRALRTSERISRPPRSQSAATKLLI